MAPVNIVYLSMMLQMEEVGVPRHHCRMCEALPGSDRGKERGRPQVSRQTSLPLLLPLPQPTAQRGGLDREEPGWWVLTKTLPFSDRNSFLIRKLKCSLNNILTFFHLFFFVTNNSKWWSQSHQSICINKQCCVPQYFL